MGSTNLNTTASALQWTEDREDTGYTHSDVSNSHQITIDSAGTYLVNINVPLGGGVARSNVTGKVLLDGGLVAGGIFQQGYIRNADSSLDSSIHWSGIVTTSTTNQVITVTTEVEGTAGTITTDSLHGTIMIQEMPSTNVFYE